MNDPKIIDKGNTIKENNAIDFLYLGNKLDITIIDGIPIHKIAQRETLSSPNAIIKTKIIVKEINSS